jgi:ubiquitin-protein ligase E3 C
MVEVCKFIPHFNWLVNLSLYRMFNQQEVQILIGGINLPIDLDDLQWNTNYGRLYDEK